MIVQKIIPTEDGSHTLWNEELNESYHSFHGAKTESEHVFIENGIRKYLQNKSVSDLKVFEVGFGTGLNALLALRYAEQYQLKVHYTSLEPYPIDGELASSLNYTEYEDLENYQSTFLKLHKCDWEKEIVFSEFFTLIKREDVLESVELESENYEVVFFDAFAPNKQPDVWKKPLLEKVYISMKKNALLTTYCAQGQFKRDLKSVGFDIENIPGPPGKKEMTVAIKV